MFWSWTDTSVIEDPYLQLEKLTGELRFRISSGPDFDANETKTLVREIRVTDLDGNYTDGNFTINVINLNDNPPLSPYLFANASSTFTLQENSNIIIDLNASDLTTCLIPGSTTSFIQLREERINPASRFPGRNFILLSAANFEYPDRLITTIFTNLHSPFTTVLRVVIRGITLSS